MTVAEHEAASAQIVARFFGSIDMSAVRVLHCFVSIEHLGEVDTRPIFQRIWNDFSEIQTVVPRIDRTTDQLESLRYGRDVELALNRWQIHEPVHDERVEPFEIDIVVVPLLCFDERGHRVGYGKAYYDRFLAKTRSDCQKIGLCVFPPVDEITDANELDVKLDLCITPEKIYRFS
jgi:5-formyltetrahydrofolate cyclo-ligase